MFYQREWDCMGKKLNLDFWLCVVLAVLPALTAVVGIYEEVPRGPVVKALLATATVVCLLATIGLKGRETMGAERQRQKIAELKGLNLDLNRKVEYLLLAIPLPKSVVHTIVDCIARVAIRHGDGTFRFTLFERAVVLSWEKKEPCVVRISNEDLARLILDGKEALDKNVEWYLYEQPVLERLPGVDCVEKHWGQFPDLISSICSAAENRVCTEMDLNAGSFSIVVYGESGARVLNHDFLDGLIGLNRMEFAREVLKAFV